MGSSKVKADPLNKEPICLGQEKGGRCSTQPGPRNTQGCLPRDCMANSLHEEDRHACVTDDWEAGTGAQAVSGVSFDLEA